MIDINPQTTQALIEERQQRIKSCWYPRTATRQPGLVRLAMGRTLIRLGEFVAGRQTIRSVSAPTNLRHRVIIS